MPLNRLQTLLSQESLKIGNTYYDKDLISAIPLLKSVPPEILSYIPQISGNPRQLGRYFFLWKGCWTEVIRNGISSSIASVFMGMLMTKFCSSEKQNDSIAAAVPTSTCTPGMYNLSQADGENLGDHSGKVLVTPPGRAHGSPLWNAPQTPLGWVSPGLTHRCQEPCAMAWRTSSFPGPQWVFSTSQGYK